MSTSYKSVLVNHKEIPYNIRYSKKAKYLQLKINDGELELVLPRWCTIKEGEKFLIGKTDWIGKHFKNKSVEKSYTFLGRKIEVKQYYNLFLKKHKVRLIDDRLEIESPEDSDTSIEEIYNSFLKNSAKKFLINHVKKVANELNFSVNRISLRSQKTRWGSCSSKGNLSFNHKLMKYRKEVIDYVIIHELCHLKEMNHSKRFWQLVENYCPDYKSLRSELKAL